MSSGMYEANAGNSVPSTARPTPRLPSSAPAPSPAPSVGPLPPPTEPASEEEEDDVNAALDEEITAARKKMLDEQDRITGEVETRVEDLQRIIAAETAKAETELIKVTKEGQEKIKALEARKRR